MEYESHGNAKQGEADERHTEEPRNEFCRQRRIADHPFETWAVFEDQFDEIQQSWCGEMFENAAAGSLGFSRPRRRVGRFG